MNKQKQNAIAFFSLFQRLEIATLIAVTILIINPAYSYAGLIIRGGQCSANAFERGAELVSREGYITGLSVNYTRATSDKARYARFLQGIDGYGQYCVATDEGIGKAGVKLVEAPIQGNPLHAKLNGYSQDIAKKLTRYP
jgi:hypothetical protein